jgi:CubicO group peptidase (beta-lactamase class C family)
MKKIIVRTLVCLMVVWSLATLTYTTPESRNGHAFGKVKQKLNAYFNSLTETDSFSGSVLVAQKGRVILRRGYGMADYEEGIPNRPRTVFAIASLTKAFTAMSIMILEERGLISVNDPISLYVPESPYGNDITIHQLLRMTSGLYRMLDNPDLWGVLDQYHTPEDLLDYFITRPLRFAPGSQWEYSNSCYITLGVIIERVTGMTYREFIQENILGPLRMRSTSYDPTGTDFACRKAVGYDDITTTPPTVSFFVHPTITFSAGSIYSTVNDMYKWDQAMYSEKLVSFETLQRMFTPGDHYKYGYGWFIDNLEVDGKLYKHVWHWGAYIGFHSFFARLVDEKITVILLRNTSACQDTEDEQRPIIKEVVRILKEKN